MSCINTTFVFCAPWQGKGCEALAQNEPKAWDGSKEVTEQDALSAREEADRILNSDRCSVTERRAALETLKEKLAGRWDQMDMDAEE